MFFQYFHREQTEIVDMDSSIRQARYNKVHESGNTLTLWVDSYVNNLSM